MYRLEPRRRGDVQLLGVARRGHGLQSNWLRGSHWDFRLVATCLVIPALTWRENGLARIDLFQRGEQPR